MAQKYFILVNIHFKFSEIRMKVPESTFNTIVLNKAINKRAWIPTPDDSAFDN